jgi:Zn-dependent protease
VTAFDWVLFTVYLGVGVLVALVFHEYGHAFVATRLHDPTPRQFGRLTLNPRPHVDRFGTIVLPAILLLPVVFGQWLFPIFAYAKPQPVGPWTSRRDRDVTLIALAGPGANFLLAILYGLVMRAAQPQGQVGLAMVALLQTTVVMGVLHIVPIPGLDGSRIVARFLPTRAREIYTNLDQYLPLFILVVFFLLKGAIFSFVGAIGNGICDLVAGTPCALP